METIIMYLIYVLATIVILSLSYIFILKIQGRNFKKDMLKMLIENNYETDKIDLEKIIK